MTCEELKAKNALLQQASDLYSKSSDVAPSSVSVAPPTKPAKAPRRNHSARRIVTPKHAVLCNDDEDYKDGTFLTNSAS